MMKDLEKTIFDRTDVERFERRHNLLMAKISRTTSFKGVHILRLHGCGDGTYYRPIDGEAEDAAEAKMFELAQTREELEILWEKLRDWTYDFHSLIEYSALVEEVLKKVKRLAS